MEWTANELPITANVQAEAEQLLICLAQANLIHTRGGQSERFVSFQGWLDTPRPR